MSAMLKDSIFSWLSVGQSAPLIVDFINYNRSDGHYGHKDAVIADILWLLKLLHLAATVNTTTLFYFPL